MSDSEIPRTVIRISMLGDAAVGKTSIINVFLGIKFSSSVVANIGIERQNKKMTMKDGKEMKIIVWDTAGQERFHSIATSTIKNSHGIALCFDVTTKKSFDNLSLWLKDIKAQNTEIPIVLFGNKCDLIDKRVVEEEEAEAFANANKLEYFETSAKENINVEEGFTKIIEDAYEKTGGATLGSSLENVDKKDKKKKKC
jgi:small GTP-binding protein